MTGEEEVPVAGFLVSLSAVSVNSAPGINPVNSSWNIKLCEIRHIFSILCLTADVSIKVM